VGGRISFVSWMALNRASASWWATRVGLALGFRPARSQIWVAVWSLTREKSEDKRRAHGARFAVLQHLHQHAQFHPVRMGHDLVGNLGHVLSARDRKVVALFSTSGAAGHFGFGFGAFGFALQLDQAEMQGQVRIHDRALFHELIDRLFAALVRGPPYQWKRRCRGCRWSARPLAGPRCPPPGRWAASPAPARSG
jgi:hypothetical protein